MALVFSAAAQSNAPATRAELGLITLDPGHFHAALFQKEMLPGVAPTVHVYAPLGPDLIAHLNRVAQFNGRKDSPTKWEMAIDTHHDFFERLLQERRGNVVVISGRNRGKIERIEAIARAGLHVLADKPWIIEPEDWPKLRAALDAAERNGVVAFDAMTQRFEISCLLQRELVNDPEIFGARVTGSLDEPAIQMESMHYLLKEVAGAPSLRPAWFFDIRQQGEGLTDVGTHLVDLVQWIAFPGEALDCEKEIRILRGSRWPTVLTVEQFRTVTGESEFPESLGHAIANGELRYSCNNTVHYTVRGVQVRLDIKWDFTPPPGAKDTEVAIFRGSKARIEVRQGREENYVPEIYVVPVSLSEKKELVRAVERRIALLQKTWPGVAARQETGRIHVTIPERLRIGHEAHFTLLVRQFLDYVRNPKSVPAWEKPNMLAKYYVTTEGVALARRNPQPTASH